MKRTGIIIATIILVAVGVLAFAMPNRNPVNPNTPDNPKTPKNDYETMWKKVKENLEKDLPESAEKELNAIEEKASKDKNQTQMLKTWLYRQNIMQFTVEEDPQQAFIQYAETKVGQLDEVHDALLHEEIAKAYANYLESNEWRINENLPIDGDLSKVEMKYWDKESFRTCINQHYDEALKPVEALKKAKTEDFMVLYENKHNNEEYIEYEASLFEFMFHRVANYYQEQADADDVEGETDAWWLSAKDFVKVDLGESDNPLTKCLKIYQDLIAYNLKNKNEDVLIYNDFKRFGFVNGILQKDAQYQAAMEDLKAQHRDNPLSAEITSLIARNMMNQYENNSSDSTYFDNYKKAKAMCEEAIAKFPKSTGAKNCQNLIKRIEEPQIDLSLNQVQLPKEAIPAVLEYRNTTAPYYRIVKVSEKELKKLKDMRKEDLLKELNKMSAVAEHEFSLPAETDYRQHSTLIALPALERGIYFLIATTERGIKSEEKTLLLSFQVSNLGFITDTKDDKMTVVTVDRKTGKTVEGVTVEVYRREWDYKAREYKTTILATPKTDRNGRAEVSNTGDNSFNINLRKGDDNLLSNNYFRLYERYKNNSETYRTQLFTDRAIYRPGQTVYFQGIVTRRQGEDLSLVHGYLEKVSFRDANWQEISSADFKTDEYGSFSGSFVIPTDRLNGVFHLNAKQGNTTIRVEEYKRPTFEVTFERPKEQYKLNQEVTVRGDVKAYAGFGLDDVEYSYRVIRKTSFPWRCWWWWYPTVEDEQITYGKARTDENGKFAVTFNLKPSLTIAPEKQPVFTYEIEVTATSKQGETHADTYSIRAGYNEIAISTDVPSEVEKSDIGKYQISVSNLSWQPAKSRILRKIYRYENAAKINYFEAIGHKEKLDRQLLSDEEMERLFPEYSFYDKSQVPEPAVPENSRRVEGPARLVDESEIMVDDKAKFYESKALEPGKYVVELTSLDDPLAKVSQQFTVFENGSKKLPFTTMEWAHQDKSTAHPGDEIQLSLGSSAKDVDIWVQLLHGDEVRMDKKITVSNNVQTLSYKVIENDRGGLSWRYAFVKENSFNTDHLGVSVPFDNYDLDVKLATVRDKLSPGAEETWEVTVSDYKKKPLEAALLAGMYDASLDEFARNSWWFNMSPSGVSANGFGTDGHGFTSSNTGLEYFYFAELFNFSLPSDAPFFDFGYGYHGRRYSKGGRVLYDEMAMEEAAMPRMSGAVLQKNSVAANDADESAEAEEMVEIAKQEAPIETGGAESSKEPAEPTLRENFNETAFFFPQLRTNNDGSATFSFTMPDALTRWRLMLMAYTKDRKTGSKEYTFTSSKPVMIMADMPRYMYDNDELWFVANVINTGDEPVTPKAKLEIFDAASMQPVNIIVTNGPSTGSGTYTIPMETILPGRSKEVRWKVKAKYDLELLAFRFTAYAGQFSDAEQHLLPVLSSEIFMTQTLPITVKAETEQTFDFEAIANPDSHERDYSLTLNFSTNPVWYAVQALPYLANISTDRAETAFYVFYANTLSSYIADHIPNLLNYIKKWQIETPDALLSQLEKDQDLKAIMLQETPWVLEAKSETEQRSRIATLFEVNTMRGQQTRALNLISQKQKYNGGWSWMDGMPESAYITTYILSGFGKLQKMGAWSSLSKADQNTAQSICEKAVRFIEYDVAETYRYMKKYSKGKDWPIGASTLNELYALSFFKEQNSDKDFAKAKDYYLKSLAKDWTSFNFNERSKGASVLYRNGNEKTAKLMIQSFKECAQKNEQIGMYWPKKYFSFESHIATHANIMAAFAEIDQNQEMIDQLRVWLLTQKQTNKWENSASTTDAIYALLMRGSDWFAEGKEVTLRFGNTPISTEGGVAGTGFIQRRWNANEVTQDMRQLTVNNPTPHLVWGGLFRQYFVPIDEVKSDESGFTIKRELFVETVTDKGKKLVPVEKQALKVGDKLTVKITFTSQQDMSFVFVKDLRAAGFEPIEQVSHYEYNDRMSYYQSNTDTDMEFFIEKLPKGTHQLEYSMFVTKEGYLNNGYALIQCQYAPEFSAYSDGMRVKVGE
jgi:5-hydroxyisourate hydrolase-like protein (transthyretin family)